MQIEQGYVKKQHSSQKEYSINIQRWAPMFMDSSLECEKSKMENTAFFSSIRMYMTEKSQMKQSIKIKRKIK